MRDLGFVVTDGLQSYTVTVIEIDSGGPPLLMFLDEIPPQNTDMWVVHHALDRVQDATSPASGGVICFTPGTRIETPEGPRPVEELHEGDRVQTRDSGAQEIRWIGCRRMTGARLFAMPRLRPVRLRAGALGGDVPARGDLYPPAAARPRDHPRQRRRDRELSPRERGAIDAHRGGPRPAFGARSQSRA
jgi:hypothetical protein